MTVRSAAKATASNLGLGRQVAWLQLRWFGLSVHARNARLLAEQRRTGSTQPEVRRIYEQHYETDLAVLRASAHPVLDHGRLRQADTDEIDARFVEEHVRRLGPSITPDARVLEVGCGYGRTLVPMSLRFPKARITGIEPTAGGPDLMGAYAGVRGTDRPPVSRADGRRLPFPDGTFDVVYTNLVLEQLPHTPDLEALLLEVRRVGRGVVGFLEPWDDAQTPLTRAFIAHRRYLSAGSSILERLGFHDVRSERLPFHHNAHFRVGYVTARVSP